MLKNKFHRSLLCWLAFLAFMCAVPLFASTGVVRVLIFGNFLAIFAMSWDIISGRTGYISFGHPFLIGIAGYTTAILTRHLDFPLYFSIPLAILATIVGGYFVFLFPRSAFEAHISRS